jgi:hypothetical protein
MEGKRLFLDRHHLDAGPDDFCGSVSCTIPSAALLTGLPAGGVTGASRSQAAARISTSPISRHRPAGEGRVTGSPMLPL